ncbi:hypothetical protein KC573_04575 [candidate division WWE3 bacterium]|uniref:Cytochrome b5 heme-binding domain-containing protein n=1 Tax=candidate division WWE3 bacterium TaxID=2053526 RepID=A0A955RXQ5_UNCKA|nr:hypothetical protein [candidate division WWE3 bacterium]
MIKKLLAITIVSYGFGVSIIVIMGAIRGDMSDTSVDTTSVQDLIQLAQQSNQSQLTYYGSDTVTPSPSEMMNEPTGTPSDIAPTVQQDQQQSVPTPTQSTTSQNQTNIPTPTSQSVQQQVSTATPIPPTPTAASLACGAGGPCTSAQVSQHNSRSDCWVIVSSKVYNVTSYVNKHPGGAAAFDSSTCGHNIDLYMQGVLTTAALGKKKNHGSGAYADLNSYYIGNLIN